MYPGIGSLLSLNFYRGIFVVKLAISSFVLIYFINIGIPE